MKIKTKSKAFTLIELLVVIVIIGILSGIGIASFRDYTNKAELAKAKSFAAQAVRILQAKTISDSESFLLHYPLNDFPGGNTTEDASS